VRTSQRLAVGLTLIVLAIAAVAYSGIRSAAVYYLTPTEFAARPDLRNARVRLAGRVEPGSVRRDAGRVEAFTIGDGATTIDVRYDGPLPDLFAEGREVLVEGRLDGAVLDASRVMTTHPADYREAPPR